MVNFQEDEAVTQLLAMQPDVEKAQLKMQETAAGGCILVGWGTDTNWKLQCILVRYPSHHHHQAAMVTNQWPHWRPLALIGAHLRPLAANPKNNQYLFLH